MKLTGELNAVNLIGAAPKPAAPETAALHAQTSTEGLSQNQLTADVYRPAAPLADNPVYNKPVQLGPIVKHETFEEMADRTARAVGLLQAVVLPRTAEKMFAAYQQVTQQLLATTPALAAADWGFSVAQDGRLTVSGNVNDTQRQQLETALNNNTELLNLANSFKDTLMQGTALLREANGNSRGWAKYGVSADNFSAWLDFKALFSASQQQPGAPAVGGGKLNPFMLTEAIYQQIKH